MSAVLLFRTYCAELFCTLLLLVLLVGMFGCSTDSPPQGETSERGQADSAQAPPSQSGPDATDSSAAAYLKTRLQEYDRVLYVYKDFADGVNHYSQKAWMGSSYESIPAMDEAAEGYDGTSGIACVIDLARHSWGGYMFLNGILPEGQTEPVQDFGDHDAGLDLTGAKRLTFYAKGESGGERVEFFMGGLGYGGAMTAPYADSTMKRSLGYVTLDRDWQRFEIPLDNVDLSRIGCGFGWVTNDQNNLDTRSVRFYVDEIRYEFAEDRVEPMFLQSYGTAAPGTDDAIINNFAYLYDQCAAAMALSYAGEDARACQIADAIVYALEHDRYYTDGRLRNAYMSGNPASFPGWLSVRGEEFARMPGFYDAASATWYEDVYAVSAGSTGNMAWAILALCEVYENCGEDEKYLQAARRIADFVLTLETKNGFMAGYEGWEGNETKATYLSTEHNTDLIAAFGRLHALTGVQKYAEASALAKAFVLSMYDEVRGCFYTGTGSDGVTINKEVIPLDCQTWTILALGESFEESEKALAFVEDNMALTGGYDFNTDKDGIWYEGTAQVALAYLLCGDEAAYAAIMDDLNAACLTDGSITAADRDGVSTGFAVSGLDIPWEYGKRIHVGATAWLAFAQMGRNPFAV